MPNHLVVVDNHSIKINKMENRECIKGLVLNIIFPGIGTIFLKNKKYGEIQLGLFISPIAISVIFGAVLNDIVTKSAFLPLIFFTIMFSVWIWALSSSIRSILSEKQKAEISEETEKSKL